MNKLWIGAVAVVVAAAGLYVANDHLELTLRADAPADPGLWETGEALEAAAREAMLAQPEFPERIVTGEARPVDAASAFIEQRYEQLTVAFQKFEIYAQAVRGARGEISFYTAARQLRFGYIIHRETQRDTESIVRAYPEWALMSPEERSFIERKLALRAEELGRAMEDTMRRVTRLGWPDPVSGLDESFLILVFTEAYLVPAYLVEISDVRLESFVRALRDSLLAADREALWQAIAAADGAMLRDQIATDSWGQSWRALFEHGQPVIAKDFGRDEDEAEWLSTAVLVQSLTFEPMGQQAKMLAHLGINTFLGSEALEVLQTRLMAVIERVEAAAAP